MDTINLLLANSQRQLTNLIEAQVLDVCYNQALVRSTRTARVDELVELGRSGQFQLIIVAAENLTPGPGRRAPWVSVDEAINAIRIIRSRCSTPIIAVAVFPEDAVPLGEAGAQCVVRLPFEAERLKAEVRQLLKIPELVVEEEPAPTRRSLSSLFLRRFGLLKSA